MTEMEVLLEQEICPGKLAKTIDDTIFTLVENHLELQGEPQHRELQNQVHSLRRLRDVCDKIQQRQQ